MTHPQEIVLVRRGEATGRALPTRDLQDLTSEAGVLGTPYVIALREQVERQRRAVA